MMRKRPTSTIKEPLLAHDEPWIDIETAAVVEVSSEQKDFPIDSALLPGEATGWRATKPGTQTVRLMFHQPQKVRRIVLVFEENDIKRTKISFCDGLRMVDIHSKKLSVSSGISAHPILFGRSRTMKLNSRALPYLN